ncbi:glycosyltransferase family 2 protein [Alkalicoccus luteus]|uniref:Glycosyltransferase n=1 Tax=Alkalicoccus luteus TaxID=1237094 RepID=A0A969Q094_9BACI|nr:glycosyltransferase [Alkalicoccus luteus]
MCRISVIALAYNLEEYLPACIESVLNQTFQDFELIIINDGSTDNSGDICDSYAAKDERITVIHKENNGIASARKHRNKKRQWYLCQLHRLR